MFEQGDDIYEGLAARATFDDQPSRVASLLMALVLLALIFMTGMAVLELQQRFAFAIYIYAGVVLLVLGLLAAIGRFTTPKPLQYLLSFVVVLIPVLGWLYGLYFSGKVFARTRRTRLLTYVLLLGITAFTFLRLADLDKIRASLPRSGASVVTEVAVALPTDTMQPTSTRAPTASATTVPSVDTPTQEPTRSAAPIENCLHWSEVTNAHVDQKVCVYGDYIRYYEKGKDTYVLVFDESPGSFQLLSYPKPIEQYLPADGRTCVVARGWLRTNGIRPYIELRIYDILEPCS